MNLKTEYLCEYDYGTGGIWFIVNAHSTSEIESKFPGITAFEDKPEWMKPKEKEEYFSRCKSVGFRWDINEEPTGWLKTYLKDKKLEKMNPALSYQGKGNPGEDPKRMIQLSIYAILIFIPLFAYYVYDTRDADEFVVSVFFPDAYKLKEIRIESTDGEKERIIINTMPSILEFEALIRNSYQHKMKKDGCQCPGKYIVTYVYEDHDTAFMIRTEKDEAYVVLLTGVTSGWHFGRFRVDGYKNFLDEVKGK